MTWTPRSPQEVAGSLLLSWIHDLDASGTRLGRLGEQEERENTQHICDELFDAYQWMTNKEPLPVDGKPKIEYQEWISSWRPEPDETPDETERRKIVHDNSEVF